MRNNDRRFMQMALHMARRGLGTTAPNPSVGAVIVDRGGVILGRGWTQPGGRPHAEVAALERAGTGAMGATLYVTLEPCSHTGKSPPCADAVIAAGIERVVCALHDPDERVAGRGFARLRAAGIEVIENTLSQEARWLTLGHILRVTEQRPFVQLKLATGADGLIAPGDGAPVWVTGKEARAQGHLLRARADAILLGIGTVLADDPLLDCRLPGLAGQSPDIFVLDRHNRLPGQSKIATNGRLAGIFGETTIKDMLEDLADRGMTRLLVEGGPHVWRSFLDAGLVDEIVHFEGAGRAGQGGLLPFVDAGLERITENAAFKLVDQRPVGSDKMSSYRRVASNTKQGAGDRSPTPCAQHARLAKTGRGSG